MKNLAIIINPIITLLERLIPILIWGLIIVNFGLAIYSGFEESQHWFIVVLIGHLYTLLYVGIGVLCLTLLSRFVNQFHVLSREISFRSQLQTFKYYWITLLGSFFAAEIHFLEL